MTLAEARKRLNCKTNYQLAQQTGIPEYKISRWKHRNNRVPDEFRDVVRKAEPRKHPQAGSK